MCLPSWYPESRSFSAAPPTLRRSASIQGRLRRPGPCGPPRRRPCRHGVAPIESGTQAGSQELALLAEGHDHARGSLPSRAPLPALAPLGSARRTAEEASTQVPHHAQQQGVPRTAADSRRTSLAAPSRSRLHPADRFGKHVADAARSPDPDDGPWGQNRSAGPDAPAVRPTAIRRTGAVVFCAGIRHVLARLNCGATGVERSTTGPSSSRAPVADARCLSHRRCRLGCH